MPFTLTNRKFAELTWFETVHYYSVLLHAPFVILWTILTIPFVPRSKSIRRTISDGGFKYLVSSLNTQQIQKFLGTDESILRSWANKNDVYLFIEKVRVPGKTTSQLSEEDTFNMFWIGKKDAKKVVLYLHGGGFVLPVQDYSLMFWRHVQLEVAKRNQDALFSIAIPIYTLATQSPFPTQLRQASAALQHILKSGSISPSNIIITGDSAGANLTYQILQHLINPRILSVPPIVFPNPLPSTSESTPNSKLGGAFFMSPWIDLKGTTRGFTTNLTNDIVSVGFYLACGAVVLSGIDADDKESQAWVLGTLDPTGIEKYVDDILVFAGGKECMIDSALDFTDRLSKVYSGRSGGHVELMLKEHGAHDDMFFDFSAGEKVPSRETERIVEWVMERFA